MLLLWCRRGCVEGPGSTSKKGNRPEYRHKITENRKKSEMVYAVVITLETGFRVYFQIRKYSQICPENYKKIRKNLGMMYTDVDNVNQGTWQISK